MMYLLAHTGSGTGYGANPVLAPWEIHPILIHFPIAFLLGAVILSAYASLRGRFGLERAATGLFIAGIATGFLAGAAGLLAFLTVPDTHTELAHRLMYWHLGLMVGSLLMFAAVTWLRWGNWDVLPGAGTQFLMWLATAVFVVGTALGGHIVYHGGTGIEEDLLKPGLHEDHHRGHGTEEHPGRYDDSSGHESSHQSH
jgi:uncharacterized membrane protein